MELPFTSRNSIQYMTDVLAFSTSKNIFLRGFRPNSLPTMPKTARRRYFYTLRSGA